MHEWGDSGIAAVLLAIVVAVVLSLGVAQQARARGARCQEIRRMQAEAAEEARREEAEADAEYTSMVANRSFCAICLSHTTTRCSRCKTVRYCSSTCQAQHWKQGHRQECRAPAAPSPGSSSNGSRSFSDAFSSGSSRSGSRTLSQVSDLLRTEDMAPTAYLSRSAPSSTANGILVRPQKILFPYDSFVKFFNCERLKVPPCGLINCGNSCFANVVLQCLTYTRPLTAYLLEGSHVEECRRNDWCFMCELQDHVWRVRQSQNPFSPIRILSRIRNIGNHLGYGRQEDAHEFMRFAIDSMQSICLDEAGGEKSVDAHTQETTFIHHIFGGHLQSQVKCMQCLHESNRYENMMDLAVEIQGCVETLEDALTQFTAPELLDGENKYKCDRCMAYVKARKRLTLHEAPNILTIALKRFQGGKFGKLNKRVTFPEVLDVMPYMSVKGDKPPLYRLYAVVVHVDMLNASFFGHYICYVKDAQGLWYKIDDSKVKEVDIEKVMAQRAYMLFYTRSSARPPPVTDGAVLPYTVVDRAELGVLHAECEGDLKVFPTPQQLRNYEMPSVGETVGLHPVMDFDQMRAYVEESPESVPDHSFSTGQISTPHYGLWDINGIPNDDITVEDSGCVASGSSLTVTSPCMSSFRSNHGLWFPSQGVVCQVPDGSTVDGTEDVTLDQKSPLPSDFSEVNLQTCSLEKPCPAKVGKRRLEDGLSPLPTPKPLDTDQLPTWPTGNHGRSISSPPVLHLSANQTSCSVSTESYSSWSNPESENNGESLLPTTFLVQHRISGDQTCGPVVKEPGLEPERIDSTAIETIEAGQDEELVARAKRQHVEFDTRLDSEGRVQRPDKSQALESCNLSESCSIEMDWDDSRQQPGSLSSCPSSCDSVVDPCAKDLSLDPRKCFIGNEVQNFPAPFSQMFLKDQETGVTLSPMKADEIPSNASSPSIGRDVSGGDLGVESTDQELRPALQSSATSSSILTGGEEDLTAPSSRGMDLKNGLGKILDTSGESRENSVVMFESLGMYRPLSPSIRSVPTKALEISACTSGDTRQEGATLLMDHVNLGENMVENHVSDHELQRNASNGPVSDMPDKSVLGKVQKTKSAAKPLFAPGFLNRAGASVSKSKAKPTLISSKAPSEEANCQSDKVEGGHVREDKTYLPEVDQHCSSRGSSHGAVNGQSPTAGNNMGSSCGGCMNCELCNSACLENGIENGHHTENGLVPGMHDKKSAKTGGQGDDESSTKVQCTVRPHAVNGLGPTHTTPATTIDEAHSMEPVTEVASLGRPVSGRQKQGRNETCNCGSQRKWKKCCGKSGVIKPEPGRRRLVV